MSISKHASKNFTNDVVMAALVVSIIAPIILPLPVLLIDVMLALSLSTSVLLLVTTLFIPNAVALSSFPSLLLFTTLFRLALNIASTKAILLHAEAGHVIQSVGELVMGGNLVVGIVVFLLIIVVQFIVISKGSERVAEVGARFTLDAMPGKQMSIDADLRSGHITADEAQRRRAHLAMENQMHGGMDGAMKYVKGDAIAGLIITAVNLLAGILVGVLYHGMTAGESAHHFSILSIGDAMVSAIPSLLISVAAGVLITRVADDTRSESRSLGQEILEQMTASTRAIYVAAVLVLALAAIPGFPSAVFVLLSLGLALTGRFLSKRNNAAANAGVPMRALQREGAKGAVPTMLVGPPPLAQPLAMRVSAGLAAAFDYPRFDTALTEQRLALQSRLGVPFPGVTMWVCRELPDSCFEVLINDVPVRRVIAPAGHLWLTDADSALAAQAQRHGPLMHQDRSLWVAASAVPADQSSLCVAVEDAAAKQIVACLSQHAHMFVGIQEVQGVIDRVAISYPGLALEVQKILPLPRIAEVLRRLLEEQVPVRNMRSIFESLVNWGPREKDLLMLTEHVRGDLGRYLAFEAGNGEPYMQAILLDPAVEKSIRQCIKNTPTGNFLALPPEEAEAIFAKVQALCAGRASEGLAVVTSIDIRRYVRKIVEPRLGWLRVYSYQELAGFIELRPVGHVTA